MLAVIKLMFHLVVVEAQKIKMILKVICLGCVRMKETKN